MFVNRDGRPSYEPCPVCIGGVDHCCGGDMPNEYDEVQLDLFEWADRKEKK